MNANRKYVSHVQGAITIFLAQYCVASPAFPQVCADEIRDQASPTDCIDASSTPVNGSLYPLGPLFMIKPNGNVGINKLTPGAQLHQVVPGGKFGHVIDMKPNAGRPFWVTDADRNDLLILDEEGNLSTRGPIADVTAFGAVPDDGASDRDEIQAAIDHIASVGGGTVFVPSGTYLLDESLRISAPVNIIGSGLGQVTLDVQSQTRGVTTLKVSAAMAEMISIKGVVIGELIHGVQIRDLFLEGDGGGAALASIGIHAESVRLCTFENIFVRGTTMYGIQLDDGNGYDDGNPNTRLHGSYRNQVRNYRYIYRPNSPGGSGLFMGSVMVPAEGGACQNRLENISTHTKDGDGIRIGSADNNMISRFQGFVADGDVGIALRLLNGEADKAYSNPPARNNYIQWMVGDVVAENETRGNRIVHLISEGSSVALEGDAIDGYAQMHYEILDRVHGDLFQTHSYVMSDELAVGAADFMVSNGASIEASSSDWAAVVFPDAGTSIARASIPVQYSWSNGNIKGINLRFSTDASAGTARIRLRIISASPGANLNTVDVDQLVDVPVAGSPELGKYHVAFTIPVTHTRGDSILVKLERDAGSPADTLAGDFELYGITLGHRSLGPDGSPGSDGPWDIPAPFRE